MLPSLVVEEYLDDDGRSPFAAWFDDLPPDAAARVAVGVSRLERGVASDVKGVGDGVLEYRIHWGPGVRIYFGRDGETLVILLGGGSKRRQEKDIEAAKLRWNNYKARKRGA